MAGLLRFSRGRHSLAALRFAMAILALCMAARFADAPGPWLAAALGGAFALLACFSVFVRARLQHPSHADIATGVGGTSPGSAEIVRWLVDQAFALKRPDHCTVVRRGAEGQPSARSWNQADPAKASALEGDLAARIWDQLASLSETDIVAFQNLGDAGVTARRFARRSMRAEETSPDIARESAKLLGARSFLSLPIRSADRLTGFLVLSARTPLSTAGLSPLAAIADLAASRMERAMALERATLGPRLEERRRVGMDLRDGFVQPYIGLKLGIEALRRKVPADHYLASELDELAACASQSIQEIRDYALRLEHPDRQIEAPDASRVSLLESMRAEVARFSRRYGIEVKLESGRDVLVSEHVKEEVRHLIRGALLNVHEHTTAKQAVIAWAASSSTLQLNFINDDPQGGVPPDFNPRSLDQRARRLGGHVEVLERSPTRTQVAVEIAI